MPDLELEASRARLETQGLRLAVRIQPMTAKLLNRSDAVPDGMVAWTPEEMLRYVELPEHDRKVWMSLKMRYKATSTFLEAK